MIPNQPSDMFIRSEREAELAALADRLAVRSRSGRRSMTGKGASRLTISRIFGKAATFG